MRITAAPLILCGLLSCSFGASRQAEIINSVVDTDELLFFGRPDLMDQKVEAMAGSRYAFWRGTVPLYRRDLANRPIGVTDFPASVYPAAHGDPHMENFGTLLGADGELALEANDFDGADRLPYHWDLRRLTVGLVVAAELSNDDDPEARQVLTDAAAEIVATTVSAYARAMRRFADGGERRPLLDDDARRSPLVRDLFRRARRDREDRSELDELTMIDEDGTRRFLRGALDPGDSTERFEEVPEFARQALIESLDGYRRSLVMPPPHAFFEVRDMVREFGAGVASLPRLRILLLVEGQTTSTDDDVILEVKELTPSGAPPILPERVRDSVGERIMHASRTAWGREAEPLWGVSEVLGVPVQIRREAEMHKTLRVRRVEDEEGTLGAMLELSVELAELLARMHAAPVDGVEPAPAIAGAIGEELEPFIVQEVGVALAYARQQEEDFRLFSQTVDRLGPRLGIPVGGQIRPRREADLLFSAPPLAQSEVME